MLHICLSLMSFPYQRKQINQNSEQNFLNASITVLIVLMKKFRNAL